MLELEIVFWTSLAAVVYTYLGYPLLLAVAARVWGRPRQIAPVQTSISIIVSVHNEEASLDRRLDELTGLLRASGMPGEVIVVSDGSTDRSVETARRFEDRGVRVFALAENQGKAAALSLGIAEAPYELVVFADARQRWADDALIRLVENFADPRVGAVSGDLELDEAPVAMAGVGLYWRYEKWLRRTESYLASQVGVTGAISAARRALMPPGIPAGTLLDDVYWPLWIAMHGHRVVHDARAVAYDRLPNRPRDEFRRKVRTLAGNYQLVTRLPGSLLPIYNPVWLQWVSHKLMRLVVPWALMLMFASSAGLAADLLYGCLFAAQVAGYGVGMLAMIPAVGRVRFLGSGATFLVLNAAAWLAFWIWITGQASKSWRKVDYGSASSPT